jgi:hypothetical protein
MRLASQMKYNVNANQRFNRKTICRKVQLEISIAIRKS